MTATLVLVWAAILVGGLVEALLLPVALLMLFLAWRWFRATPGKP
jgi:hypothetical protein